MTKQPEDMKTREKHWKYICEACAKRAILECEDCGTLLCGKCNDYPVEEGDECIMCNIEPPRMLKIKNTRI